MSEPGKPGVDRGGAARYVVEYEARDSGPEVPALCPKCGKPMGGVLSSVAEEIFCSRCGIVFEACVRASVVSLRELRRVPTYEESGLPSPGQVLARPEMDIDIGWRRRITMVLWALLMAALMLAGLWAVVQWSA